MKSSTPLESAVFQLTPTRTRCDLVISANGKTEKVASGLLNPFLAHLKTAQKQWDKGGYSIALLPESGSDTTWFTKGTIERFVRFVSTPEVLERVYTIESEILQIEEAIAIQSNNEIGLSTVEEIPAKPVESIEGSRPLLYSNEEKAIVLYKPGECLPEANGSAVHEGNSKVQLLKVLETRKTALQKEQGMAFARAVAAGFNVDHMAPLMLFAESFGATRLRDACVRFMDLWKRKHETGQWVEIEEAEAMSNQADFSAMNASGIMLSNVINKQKEFSETSENNSRSSIGANADEKPLSDQRSSSTHEHFQGQYPHLMFPPWPIHPQPGALPVFQGYAMPGMPYYQNYSANGTYFQPPYPSVEESRHNAGQRKEWRRHSMDGRDSNTESETWEIDGPKAISQDDAELGKQTSRKKASRSCKKQTGIVVIRNINYITSKGQDASDSESGSASNSGTDNEDGDIQCSAQEMKHRSSLRSKRKESHMSSMDAEVQGTVNRKGKDEEGGQWQAFQNFLLRDVDEEEHGVDQGMFVMEKGIRARRQQSATGDDPLVSSGRDMGVYHNGNITGMHKISGSIAHMPKGSRDELLNSGRVDKSGDSGRFMDGTMDVQSTEMNGRRGGYRRTTNEDFFIYRQENQSAFTNSPSDPLAVNKFERATNDLDGRSSHNMDDDSYIVPLRSASQDQVITDGRNAIDMASEFPSSNQMAENKSYGVVNQVSYEPDELNLMPERGGEKGSSGYNPALDYELQANVEDGASLKKKNKEAVTDAKLGSRKLNKDQRTKLTDTSDKKKSVGPIRKGKPSKLSPLDEARARAERLRTYKADLQKMKKQKEEEELKRLEALKIERQKRIAARGSSIPVQSPLPSQQTQKQLPTKLSPSTHRGSKFSDSEPGPSSPLQRFPVKTSLGSSDSLKASKARTSLGSHSGGNRLTRSVSSLPEPKKVNTAVTPDTKVSMARLRRLSEPKLISSPYVSSVKPRSAEPSSKPKSSNGPESKKISAIVNYDKSKAASLPELKVRKSKETDVTHDKSAAKESTQKVNGTKSSTASEGTEMKRNKDKNSRHSVGDDNLIIEKTVVMLECEKPPAPVHKREENKEFKKGLCDDNKVVENNKVVSDYAAIRALVSPLTIHGANKEPIQHQLQGKTGSHEVTRENSGNPEKESQKFAIISVSEKPNQAPFARVSSSEGPCSSNLEYGIAPPTDMHIVAMGTEMVRGDVSDSKSLKLEKIPEALNKPQTKESSKGFRRLLKFGKKNHSSATSDCNSESDNLSVNGSEADDGVKTVASSSEVHTLKTLISQDETPTAAAIPQKSSRTFSLLSPFRSKTSEKKLTA
ncbi:COP1-interacting protein 7-like [Mangifera indica]|uniref:COP1-interacting protein 7-like n=1 Tax=Mangifera indica TaxID=29780 RepID=UPI001CFAFE06|nr:COP1-interacting protein 7-like [Mangifera indica]